MMKLCLVVAGGRDNRRRVCQIVESLGFMCAEADDGDFAYVAVQALMPDIIILDCEDPESDGPAFISRIRNLKSGGTPVMLLCVDQKSRECAQRALSAGANQFVMKPFDPGAIAGTLAELGLLDGPGATATVQ